MTPQEIREAERHARSEHISMIAIICAGFIFACTIAALALYYMVFIM